MTDRRGANDAEEPTPDLFGIEDFLSPLNKPEISRANRDSSESLDRDTENDIKYSVLKSKKEQYVDFVTGLIGVSREYASENFNVISLYLSQSYSNRDKTRFPTAESYLLHQYADRLGLEGDLDQATLWALDPSLMRQLDIEFTGPKRERLRELLPTKTERTNAKLKAELGYVPVGKERKSAITVMARGQSPRRKGGRQP